MTACVASGREIFSWWGVQGTCCCSNPPMEKDQDVNYEAFSGPTGNGADPKCVPMLQEEDEEEDENNRVAEAAAKAEALVQVQQVIALVSVKTSEEELQTLVAFADPKARPDQKAAGDLAK